MTEPVPPPPSSPPPPPPNPEDKAKVEALVAACIEALERGESHPATRLCAERPDLLTRVQRRLAQLASRGLIPASDDLPSSIGPYRVLRELGSGGMGHVYLAEQAEPVRRRVALKVIKLGMDTREVVARFQVERQALALMSHPHIAQVFDAGVTAEGRPYFVMEYVGGQLLKAFCDKKKLATIERVRLMATVCRAVQHAHDRGFIHRDLKPSNVLVSEHEGEFVPKIIDFGIAKATTPSAVGGGPADDEPSILTRFDQVLGTPEYMSPEQMKSGGIDIDTRTDVYSLGVTLYELLCGELPFDAKRLRSASRHEMERIVQDELPTQPSKRLSQVDADVVAARGGERSTVQRAVAGELDWITLKALAKQRDHRYPSALALAEDLERWLDHEPVLAAPPGRTYRLRKFVRRHQAVVSVSVLALMALVTALIVSLRAMNDAIAARDEERAAKESTRAFYGHASDAVRDLVDIARSRLDDIPAAEAVRQQLLEDALRHYEGMSAREPQDPALRSARVAALLEKGKLHMDTGATGDAITTLTRCIDDANALLAEHSGDAEAAKARFDATATLANVYTHVGRGADARAALVRALDLLAAARGRPDVIPDAELQEARLVHNLALENDDDNAKALELFTRATAIYDRVGADPVHARDRSRLALHHAEALTKASRVDAAAALLATASARLEGAPPAVSTRERKDDAIVHNSIANVLRRLDRRAEARRAAERCVELFAQLAAEHPDVPGHADDHAAKLHFLAQLHESDANLPEALATITRAVEIREGLVARKLQNHRYTSGCVRSLHTKADIELQLFQRHRGDREAPRRTLARAVELIDPLCAAHEDDVEVAVVHAAVHAAVALLAVTEERFDDAVREHELARAAMRARLAKHPNDAAVHYQLAMAGNNLLQARLLSGNVPAAIDAGVEGARHLEQGLALDARHGPLRELVPTLLGRLSSARFRAGDYEGGVRTLHQMIADPGNGNDAREQGCLLLAWGLDREEDHPRYREWTERLVLDLRRCIEARGSLAEALARPPQLGGLSLERSALRDFELFVSLAEVLGRLERRDEQERALDSAMQVFGALKKLSPGNLRNLFTQRAELALSRSDLRAAAAAMDELQTHSGGNGANYVCAVILARCHELASAGDDRERWAKAAVERLRRAITDREVPEAAAHHANFASLRGREDYEDLFDK